MGKLGSRLAGKPKSSRSITNYSEIGQRKILRSFADSYTFDGIPIIARIEQSYGSKFFGRRNILAEDNRFEWQRVLDKALLEQNPKKLKERVVEAEAAVFLRLQDLALVEEASVERLALQDASQALLNLKSDGLKFPRWRA
jgi:hypothetical protein